MALITNAEPSTQPSFPLNASVNGSVINAEPRTQPYFLWPSSSIYQARPTGPLANHSWRLSYCPAYITWLSCKHADQLIYKPVICLYTTFLQIHIVMPVRSRLKNIMAATSKYIDGIYFMLQLWHGLVFMKISNGLIFTVVAVCRSHHSVVTVCKSHHSVVTVLRSP